MLPFCTICLEAQIGPALIGIRRILVRMDIVLLLFAAIGLAASCVVWFPLRPRNGLSSFLNFFVGWIVGELAPQAVVLQSLGLAALIYFGALESSLGAVGLGIAVLAIVWLGASHMRALASRDQVRGFAAVHGLDVELNDVGPFYGFWRPFRTRAAGVRVIRDIPYGESLPGDRGGRNLLNVVQPEAAGSGRPVLLQVHGGAWVVGDKNHQGGPLMSYLAARGWVCFAINYRLSPEATFPDHIVDVKRAIAWIRAHASEYGADPDFVCITGGSAGGHLCALAALTPNLPEFQPGFEDIDTHLAAAVPFYGAYDWLDRNGLRSNHSMVPFLAERVIKCTPEENRALWELACPASHLRPDAPPLLAIQGTHDSLVFAEETAAFVEALAARSEQPVWHLELDGAQHAFDTFHCVHGACAVRAAAGFLAKVHADYRAMPREDAREGATATASG